MVPCSAVAVLAKVPEITPVETFSVRPGGRLPLDTAHV